MRKERELDQLLPQVFLFFQAGELSLSARGKAWYCSSVIPLFLWSSVTTTPGFTAFILTPLGAISRAAQWVSWSTPALLTE
jgi:hypothetical protein